MRNKFTPYIRRLHSEDACADFRTALRVEFYKLSRKPAFVIVQRGFRHTVLAVGRSRKELMLSIIGVVRAAHRRGAARGHCAARDFRAWANDFGAYARGERK